MHIDFDWDPAKAASNVQKHGVSFETAMAVFRDPLARSVLDRESDPREARWVTIGETTGGNLLVVVHTWNDIDHDRAAVRIISARRPTPNETRQYRNEPMA
ncbi:MAG TPA: BrnT family toxin [Rhizomicrobium sp.]|nr:BrnT family toxin [Rhizomicrobium sp.]